MTDIVSFLSQEKDAGTASDSEDENLQAVAENEENSVTTKHETDGKDIINVSGGFRPSIPPNYTKTANLIGFTDSCDMNDNESDGTLENKANVLDSVSLLSEVPKRFQKNAQYCGTGRLPCPALGENWSIEQIVRQQGKSAGKFDTYYYSPTGIRIRSKLKLREHVSIDLTNFDYNSGKFLDEDTIKMSANQKKKMSLLKTNKLKTIARTDAGNTEKAKITPKKLTVKFPPRKKLSKNSLSMISQNFVEKKSHKKSRPRKRKKAGPVVSISNCEDDATQNNPFNAFKEEALSLSNHFSDMYEDYQDLIQFAWNFLSIESKTQFNHLAANADEISTDSLSQSDAAAEKQYNDIPVPPKKFRRRRTRGMPSRKDKNCGVCAGCTAENCGNCLPCKSRNVLGTSATKECVRCKCETFYSSDSASCPLSMVPQRNIIGRTTLPESLNFGERDEDYSLNYIFEQSADTNSDNRSSGCYKPPNLINTVSSADNNSSIHSFQPLNHCENTTKMQSNQNNSSNTLTSDTARLQRSSYSSETTSSNVEGNHTSNASLLSSPDSGGPDIHSPQRLHKRKSRVPMYIKQTTKMEK